jgi:hypothetical protein
MSDDIKRIEIAEFRRLGLLQEVNRRFFHPIGLALEVNVEKDGTEVLGGIWDYRDDPEGIYFAGDLAPDAAKAAAYDALFEQHREARIAMFGYVVQPCGEAITND